MSWTSIASDKAPALLLAQPPPSTPSTPPQEYEGKVKVVKVEHDSNPKLIEKYKVCVEAVAMHRGRSHTSSHAHGGFALLSPQITSLPLPPSLQVYGLPCFILFKDGADISGSKKEGAVNQKMLTQYLQKFELLE